MKIIAAENSSVYILRASVEELRQIYGAPSANFNVGQEFAVDDSWRIMDTLRSKFSVIEQYKNNLKDAVGQFEKKLDRAKVMATGIVEPKEKKGKGSKS
jgi:hypothetical protein